MNLRVIIRRKEVAFHGLAESRTFDFYVEGLKTGFATVDEVHKIEFATALRAGGFDVIDLTEGTQNTAVQAL